MGFKVPITIIITKMDLLNYFLLLVLNLSHLYLQYLINNFYFFYSFHEYLFYFLNKNLFKKY